MMMKTVGLGDEKRIHYSRVSDVLYFWFDEDAEPGDHIEEAFPGVNLDYDEGGKLIGVEVHNASELLKEFIQLANASITVR